MHSAMTSKTLCDGRGVTISRQYCPIIKIHCGKASKTLREGQRVTVSGQYCVVIGNTQCHGQARHCVMDEKLQVLDSVVL